MKRGNKKQPEERGRDKLESYKKEFRKLKKENEQLRKELAKVSYRDSELKEFFEEFEQVARETELQEQKQKCPKCGSKNITEFEPREDIKYYDCIDCGARGKLDAK